MSKRLMALLSVVERDKGKKLIKVLERINIHMNFQCVGLGTAPTEMMDIFGLGSNDKDIIISLAAEDTLHDMMTNFGASFESHSKFGGIMIILNTSAASRVLTELLTRRAGPAGEKGDEAVKHEHHNNLILISVNDGYADSVMQVARKAGATGGTIIKGRLADSEIAEELNNAAKDEERELLVILAPLKTSKRIMEEVNSAFGINSKANGIITAIAAEKAYKI